MNGIACIGTLENWVAVTEMPEAVISEPLAALIYPGPIEALKVRLAVHRATTRSQPFGPAGKVLKI